MATRMPILFVGHGNPMNALKENTFTKTLNQLGQELPRPKAILCVSAHWLTEGSWVTGMEKPRTIHDFYGFPQELFEIQYPAPGSPDTAALVQKTADHVQIDSEMWGFDHGAWSVLRHLYPKADIPLVQLSINFHKEPQYHIELGKQLRSLRDQGVLILGSGNIVHNLSLLNWQDQAPALPWAAEFDEWSKQKILARDFSTLTNDFESSEIGKLSVPTRDHYLPLLYILGASHEDEMAKFEYEGIENASISMRSFSFGR